MNVSCKLSLLKAKFTEKLTFYYCIKISAAGCVIATILMDKQNLFVWLKV